MAGNKFIIFTLSKYLSDLSRLPRRKRKARIYRFNTVELPAIITLLIEEERKHENEPID